MTLNEILDMNIKNGRYVTLIVESVKTKGPKNSKRTITKRYKLNGRYGVHYYNLKEIREKEAQNTYKEGDKPQAWFKHIEQKGFVVSRKDEDLMYIQIVNPTLFDVTYWEGENQISEKQLIEEGFIKANDEEKRPIVTINLNHIKSINYRG